MHSPESILGFRSRVTATGETPRLWGHDPVELHDHFWRQIGVEIVRPGTRADASGVGPAPAGARRGSRRPRAFILLGLDELAAFAPGPAIRRLTGSRRRSVLVELVDPAAPGYVERISADERDALVAIERRYDPPPPLGSVLVTRDRRLADWWRRNVHPARHPRAATAVDRALARRRRPPMHASAVGVLEDGTDARGSVRWFETMMQLDDALAATVPGVAAREPGVWVHESARIGPYVSLAGPLWIGEHVVLEGNASLAGPRMLLDDAPRIGGSPVGRTGQGLRGGGLPGLAGATAAAAAAATATATATTATARVPMAGAGAGRAGTPGTAGSGTSKGDGRTGGLASLGARLRDCLRAPAAAGSRRGGAAAFIETRRITPAAVRLGRPGIEIRPEPHSIRVFNVLVSAMALAVALPLFPFIMAAIRIEDGRPFFFGHVRQTRGGRNFTCWKFRTMCRDAERMKSQLERENVCDGPQFHIADDPRLLRIGRLLRRFHLDELPQLWNVLRGDMNLVGPRPSPDDENQFCPAWREARLSVKPGLTGLWQIRRTRAPMADFQEWIRWDLEYVQRRSWRLDLWIIWRTALSMVRGRGVSEPRTGAAVPDRLATFTGFRSPADSATATATVGRGGSSASARVTPSRDRLAGIAGLGLWAPAGDAIANAEAVRRAAADERARTIARTTAHAPEDSGADAKANLDHPRNGAPGTDAGTVDALRRRTGDATVRGTDAPPPASPVSPRSPLSPAAPADVDVEAKPRQPVRDAEARGQRDVEAKPLADGLPRPASEVAGSCGPADTPDSAGTPDSADSAGTLGTGATADDGADPDGTPGGGRRAA